MADDDRLKDDFEQRFQSAVKCVDGYELLDSVPRDVRAVVENNMRERYRRYEREDGEDRSTPGYDFHAEKTQYRYMTRVEFMLDDMRHHIVKARPQQWVREPDPAEIWARWQGREEKLGRRPDDLEKIYGWRVEPGAELKQVDRWRERAGVKVRAPENERSDGNPGQGSVSREEYAKKLSEDLKAKTAQGHQQDHDRER
jgi:hypothetical protein